MPLNDTFGNLPGAVCTLVDELLFPLMLLYMMLKNQGTFPIRISLRKLLKHMGELLCI